MAAASEASSDMADLAGARDSAATRPARAPSARSEPGSVQSVDRAMTLLEVLAESGGSSSLTDLAERAQLNISTCHHLLATLIKWGYVAKVPGRRTYQLGARVLHLGQAFMRQVDLPRRAQPVLEQLNAATGEAVHLSVMQGAAVVTVVKREARHAVRVDAGLLGGAEPPHASAAGKAMLAWLPDDQMRNALAANGMPRLTPATIIDGGDFVEELRHVRRNGVAIDREECQPGVVGVASAVRDHAGAVVGAVCLSAPVFRADAAHLETLKQAVIAASRALSAELGAPAHHGRHGDADEAPTSEPRSR